MDEIVIEFYDPGSPYNALCQDFWEITPHGQFVYSIKRLAAKHRLPAREVTALVHDHCAAKSTKKYCAVCGASFVVESRDDFSHRKRQFSRFESWHICHECVTGQTRRVDEIVEEDEASKKRRRVREMFDTTKTRAVDPRSMSLEDAVNLVALVRLNGSEDYEVIKPLNTASVSLSAIKENNRGIVSALQDKRLIVISDLTDPDTISFEDDEVMYYPSLVTYAVSGPTREIRRRTIEELEGVFRTGDWPEQWYEEQVEVWKTIIIDEAIAYLKVSLEAHKFPAAPGEKTQSIFAGLSENYSLGQLYNIIWRAAKDTAAYYVREGITEQHATNVVVTKLQTYGERALAEGWKLTNYRRDFRCPEPMVSQVFFNAVLKIGGQGFDRKPTRIIYPGYRDNLITADDAEEGNSISDTDT